MKPIHFPESNKTFTKPESMTDEECQSLPVYQGDGFINSVWMPSEADKEAIAAGRPIILSITGYGMPPVSIFTTDEYGKPNE